MRILGIETSCDETAVCVIEAEGNFNADFSFRVLGNSLLSQASIHAQYGGVFPNLAKREHAKNLVPILEKALNESEMLHQGQTKAPAEIGGMLSREPELSARIGEYFAKYGKPKIDCIAVTVGPGLEPALWVGINFARALSKAWSVPIVAVNHMEGHVIMPLVRHDDSEQKTANRKQEMQKFKFPLLSLLISGGHTELVLSREWRKYEILGETRDDAVGEAFDKVARLLGLPYPGGPEISRLALEARSSKLEANFNLPRPMLNDDNLDFSFAGLKTAVRRIVEKNPPSQDEKLKIAREFEDAVAEVLVGKTMRAVAERGARTVIVGGGVSANTYIRLRLAEALEKEGSGATLLVPPPELATDNALMIALAGYFHALKSDYADSATMRANGNLRLG